MRLIRQTTSGTKCGNLNSHASPRFCTPKFKFSHSNTLMARFRLDSKYLFLTYPKCPLAKEDMLKHLEFKLRRFSPTYIGVSQELHQDGTEHLHCLVQLSKRCCIRRCEFFDLLNYHPNVQAARDCIKIYDYISKFQKPLEIGVLVSNRCDQFKKQCEKRTIDGWRNIIENSRSKEEYIEMVKKLFPDVFATRLHNIQYSADFLFPQRPADYISPFDIQSFTPPTEIQNYTLDHIFKVNIFAYEALHPHCDGKSDLTWMEDLTLSNEIRNMIQPSDGNPYTSAGQQEQERLPGQDHWACTTTGTGPSISLPTTTQQNTTSSMTSTLNSAHYGNNW